MSYAIVKTCCVHDVTELVAKDLPTLEVATEQADPEACHWGDQVLIVNESDRGVLATFGRDPNLDELRTALSLAGV